MKLKNILAGVLLFVMILALAGCNYIERPMGAKNNSQDTSSKLASLLIRTEVTPPVTDDDDGDYTAPIDTTPDTTPDTEPDTEPDTAPDTEPDTEPQTEYVDTPFDISVDVLKKIDEILDKIDDQRTEATNATGMNDELMAGRSISIFMPYDVVENQQDVITSIGKQLNCSPSYQIKGTGYNYIMAVKNSALSGKSADLMFVDQSIWGNIQQYAQPINSLVNFDLGDKFNTFKSSFSKKFIVSDSNIENAKYFVASGIGAPYLLAYNKANLNTSGLSLAANEEEGLKKVDIKDPVEMYNNKTWGISSFIEILKASTVGGNVGLASFLDDDTNLDIWMGMDNKASIGITTTELRASTSVSVLGDEALSGSVNNHMDLLQSIYWSQLGADQSNYIAAWVDKNDKQLALEKMFNQYTGGDTISSFTFVACEVTDYPTLKSMAGNADWDFVAYPYGLNTENIYRSSEPDDEGLYYDDSGMVLSTYAAGWASGFAVFKKSANASPALRFAEVFTQKWIEQYEKPLTDQMTKEQQTRYQSMKDNIGITFYRSVVETAKFAYPYYQQEANRLNNEERSNFSGIEVYSSNNSVLTQPMYRKNEAVGNYTPMLHTTWSEYFLGKTDPDDPDVTLSGGICDILANIYLPSGMLFVQ